MKALTIWQPWASLIMAGAKPYEFRGWRPPRGVIGQRIVIHAATRNVDVRDDVLALYMTLVNRERWPVAAAETCLNVDRAIPVLRSAATKQSALPLGVGLGTAILGEPRNGFDIAADFGIPRANDSAHDEHTNWGWPLTEIDVWVEPVPMRGAQGLWTWPEPEAVGL